MICFTIGETKRRGLTTTILDGYPAIQVGERGEPVYVPLCESFQKLVRELPQEGVRLMLESPLSWLVWDPKREELELDVQRDREDRRAIVHVRPSCLDLDLKYTSSNFEEEVVNGRVLQLHKAFPPKGVEVLVFGGIENHSLLRMLPGASFRLLRPAALSNNWSQARVIWTGRDLLFHPRIRRKEDKAA